MQAALCEAAMLLHWHAGEFHEVQGMLARGMRANERQ
jgi:hypothetical protein